MIFSSHFSFLLLPLEGDEAQARTAEPCFRGGRLTRSDQVRLILLRRGNSGTNALFRSPKMLEIRLEGPSVMVFSLTVLL